MKVVRPGRGWTLGAVLLVALALRVAYVLTANVEVGPGRFQHDLTFYRHVGLSLAAGDGYRFFGVPTAMWPPGYPVMLALVFLATGGTLLAAQLVQAVLGTLTCVGTYVLGRWVFGPGAGLVAATMLAVCPEAISFTPLLLSETLFTTLLVWLLVALVGWSESSDAAQRGRWAVFGVLAGMTTLVRGVGLLMPAIAASVWLLAGVGLRGTLARSGWMAAGMLAVLLPWAARNQRMLGAPVVVSTEVGEALFVAHSPLATGGHSIWDEAADPRAAHRHRMAVRGMRLTRDDLPPERRDVARMRAETRRALGWALANPGRELALIGPRVAFLYRHGHVAYQWGRAGGAREGELQPLYDDVWDGRLIRLADWYFYGLLGLGLLAIPWTIRRTRPACLALPLTIAGVTLLHAVVFFGDPRFHLPLLPILATLAGGLLSRAGAAQLPNKRR